MLVRWGILTSLLFSLSGCYFSLHSNQYQMVKTLLDRKEADASIESWMLYWSDYSLTSVPVNVGGETWFVSNQDIVVKFDGWHITQVTNLLPGKTPISVAVESGTMKIKESGKEIASYQCDDWKLDSTDPMSKNYIQKCREQDESVEFINNIKLRGDDISMIEFKVHPNYPSLVLSSIW